MGTLSSSNALTDSKRRVLLLKRRYGLDIRSDLNGMRISWAVSVGVTPAPHSSGLAEWTLSEECVPRLDCVSPGRKQDSKPPTGECATSAVQGLVAAAA